MIDRAVRDACPLGHRADRDGLDAALDGEFFGRVEHRVAVVNLWPGHEQAKITEQMLCYQTRE